ncbi:MAG: ABC transporter permease, partial [Acidobacteriota bacterium]|nr:ABC transporter permease [Acidobacteriota bacterium]
MTIWQDVKYGARMLAKNPGFTLVAIAVLMLGIGANTAIFSIVNAVLLRPLPYEQSDRLVVVFRTNKLLGRTDVLPADFALWQSRNQVFEGIAGYSTADFNLTGHDQATRLKSLAVTASFFSVLRVYPMIGRGFTPEESQSGRNKVVVMSHSLWQRRFNADRELLGKTIKLNGEIFSIIGVMPEDFQFIEKADVITPASLGVTILPNGNIAITPLRIIARLREGVTRSQAQAEMTSVVRQTAYSLKDGDNPQETTLTGAIVQSSSDVAEESGAEIISLHELSVGNSRLALLVLFGAVGIVLLTACANVANLSLARGATREKEIAIRTALGAGRSRIVRQLLTESLLLALLGGIGGLLLALWGVDLLLWFAPPGLPRVNVIGVDASVLGFTLLLSLGTGVLFGLAPAFHSSKLDLTESLKGSRRKASAGGRHFSLRSLLVTGEVALALVLLVGAGLLLNSFVRLRSVDLGFEPENLLTLNVSLPESYGKKEQKTAFYRQSLELIATLPGVSAAAVVDSMPLRGGRGASAHFEIGGRPPLPDEIFVTQVAVSSDFFRVMSIPLRAGRSFSERDAADMNNVAMVNEAFARRFFAGVEAIGERISVEQDGKGRPVWLEITGVVGDVKQEALGSEAAPIIYLPYTLVAYPSGLQSMTFVVRTSQAPAALTVAVPREIQVADRDMLITDVMSMQQVVAESVSDERFNSLLLGAFASLALLLAGVGIYGVTAY